MSVTWREYEKALIITHVIDAVLFQGASESNLHYNVLMFGRRSSQSASVAYIRMNMLKLQLRSLPLSKKSTVLSCLLLG